MFSRLEKYGTRRWQWTCCWNELRPVGLVRKWACPCGFIFTSRMQKLAYLSTALMKRPKHPTFPSQPADLVQTGIRGLDDILLGGVKKETSSWSREHPARARPPSVWSSSIGALSNTTSRV